MLNTDLPPFYVGEQVNEIYLYAYNIGVIEGQLQKIKNIRKGWAFQRFQTDKMTLSITIRCVKSHLLSTSFARFLIRVANLFYRFSGDFS